MLPRTLSSGAAVPRLPRPQQEVPPYYSWCRGPSDRQLRRLESVGFAVLRYTGYYGHGFYERFAPLAAAQRAFNSLMLAHPLPAMTSFALVVLRRPL